MPYIVITHIYSSLLSISYKRKTNIIIIFFRRHMRVPFSHGRKRGNRPQLPDMTTDISHGHWYPLSLSPSHRIKHNNFFKKATSHHTRTTCSNFPRKLKRTIKGLEITSLKNGIYRICICETNKDRGWRSCERL